MHGTILISALSKAMPKLESFANQPQKGCHAIPTRSPTQEVGLHAVFAARAGVLSGWVGILIPMREMIMLTMRKRRRKMEKIMVLTMT